MGYSDELLTRLVKDKKLVREYLDLPEGKKKDVVKVLLNLMDSDRTTSQKLNLASLYIGNVHKVKDPMNLKSLVCSSIVYGSTTYKEQLKLINEFLSDPSTYKKAINDCHVLSYSD